MATSTLAKRRLLYGGNALLLSLVVIGIAVAGFIAIDRWRPFRVDMTKEGTFSLAPKTRTLLLALDHEIKVTYFLMPRQEAQDADFVNNKVKDLLEEYKVRSKGKVTYTVAHPYQEGELLKQLGADSGAAVFQAGDSKVVVQSKEIFETSYSRGFEENPESKFTGEEAFDSALMRLKSGKKEMACFLTGHEEAGIDDQGKGGIYLAKEELRRENLESKSVSLLGAEEGGASLEKPLAAPKPGSLAVAAMPAKEVPADCSVLVIAGPTRKIAPEEIEAVGRYFEAGHGLVVTLQPMAASGIDPLLARLGVSALPGFTLDPKQAMRNPMMLVPSYKHHEIVDDIAAHGEAAVFPETEGMKAAEKPDSSLSLTAFLETSPAGFEWTDPKAGETKIDPDSPKNVKGPIEIGYAIEKALASGPDATTRTARAVVLGSTMFAINANLQVAGNVDLLKNSVHWASGAKEKIGIAAKDPTINSITITERQAVYVGLLTAVVFPGAIGATGVGVWWRRRRR